MCLPKDEQLLFTMVSSTMIDIISLFWAKFWVMVNPPQKEKLFTHRDEQLEFFNVIFYSGFHGDHGPGLVGTIHKI